MDYLEMGLRGQAVRAYFDQIRIRENPELLAVRRWYLAPPGAKLFPGIHAFGASVWHQDVQWTGAGIGPLSNLPGVSDPGVAPPGVCGCSTPTPLSWFLDGIPPGVVGPYPNGPCPQMGESANLQFGVSLTDQPTNCPCSLLNNGPAPRWNRYHLQAFDDGGPRTGTDALIGGFILAWNVERGRWESNAVKINDTQWNASGPSEAWWVMNDTDFPGEPHVSAQTVEGSHQVFYAPSAWDFNSPWTGYLANPEANDLNIATVRITPCACL